MKESIKEHLKPYSIFGKRKTTINHAFASALASYDEYDNKKVSDAIKILGQDPNNQLKCVYCDKPAQTWDHVLSLVKKGEFSGYGHQIGNLLPCCKECNSAKGNKPWEVYLDKLIKEPKILSEKKEKIRKYISNNTINTLQYIEKQEDKLNEYKNIKEEILNLMKKADKIAGEIRKAVEDQLNIENSNR
ncbi:HNH endonuclease [Clostridium sp. JN-1]|uniref:HNH endonuclease n=1 Tax=Clostridium sp. JN-1 TaxID=2483110 RepID=UPI000F0B68BA|nr:HNH endonuclease [Clostridium sp. JN-1]